MTDYKFDLEDRLVRFAGDSILFTKTLPVDKGGKTIEDQLTRSSMSAALNYGEVQGTDTDKDFIHKMALVLKELKESRVALKIAKYTSYGNQVQLDKLSIECNELIAISATRIKNKKPVNPRKFKHKFKFKSKNQIFVSTLHSY